jgi:hypothetical protein
LDPKLAQIIEIQASPFVDTDRVLAALTAQGLSGALIADRPGLRLLVSSPEGIAGRVLAALESLCRGLVPFVPEQLDESTFAVRPPAG